MSVVDRPKRYQHRRRSPIRQRVDRQSHHLADFWKLIEAAAVRSVIMERDSRITVPACDLEPSQASAICRMKDTRQNHRQCHVRDRYHPGFRISRGVVPGRPRPGVSVGSDGQPCLACLA